jgi:hypothetical protein
MTVGPLVPLDVHPHDRLVSKRMHASSGAMPELAIRRVLDGFQVTRRHADRRTVDECDSDPLRPGLVPLISHTRRSLIRPALG